MTEDEAQFWRRLGIDIPPGFQFPSGGATTPGASGEGEDSHREESMRGQEPWAEWEVSMQRVFELFEAAYIECELDEDNDIKVVTDSGPRLFVSQDETNKLLRYLSFYRFRPDIDELAKLRFINALNDDVIFVRFSLGNGDTLVADYYLPYGRGIVPFHIVNTAKLVGRVIITAIRQHDADDLLE
jgi:hypothetical protein